MKCEICKKEYRHLGSHIYHAHKILTREYKIQFGLPIKESLISDEIREKLRDANAENYDLVVKKNLLANGSKNWFKPGDRIGNRNYISTKTMRKHVETIEKYNKTRKMEQCVVCKLRFNHLASHLFNAHKLIQG